MALEGLEDSASLGFRGRLPCGHRRSGDETDDRSPSTREVLGWTPAAEDRRSVSACVVGARGQMSVTLI